VELETESADKHSAYVGAEDAGDLEAQPATDVRTELIAESTSSSGAAAHPTHQRLHELETENAALCGTVAALKEELRVQHLRDQTHTDLFSESSSSRAPRGATTYTSHQRLRELEAENSELKVTLATVRVKLEVQLADAVQDVARLRSESRSRQEECTSLRRELALATPPLPQDEQTLDWSMALRDEITRLKAVEMENEALCDTVAAMKEELRVQQRELLQSNTELQRKRDEVHL
jgi:chromosome segregation ATPase